MRRKSEAQQFLERVEMLDAIIENKIPVFLICGDKDPRRNDEEFLYYKPVGMGTLDLAVATRIYRNAREQGIGTWLDY